MGCLFFLLFKSISSCSFVKKYGEPGSEMYQGIKEIGNTYTVKYNEQDKYEYTLAIPHDGDVVEDDIIINAIVKYTDGNSEQQDIVVTQESNSISLKLN